MEDNKPCPCRNMSERISHEEIERIQDEIDGAYQHQENELELARVRKSKKIKTIMDELNGMTIKDQQKIYEFMEKYREANEEIIQAYRKKYRLAQKERNSNGRQ